MNGLSTLANALLRQYMGIDFYESKGEKQPKPPINYFYQVKYILKREGDNQVAKGIPYTREYPKAPSKRDIHRGNA